MPAAIAAFFVDLSGVNWGLVALSVCLIAITSTLMGLLIAVSAKEVFEAQTFSNFFRFPMLFLCGLFIPIHELPAFFRLLSYCLPLTYGTDILNGAIAQTNTMPSLLCIPVLLAFAVFLFVICRYNINRKLIL
ncbi:hypothetical protein SDC9_204177 [bioreactor metagenome]|uniref:ABC-2 type transporter transmembrane domain-containing protein n=1 Tax=bioreactor metagenome TaxID=1076179 RepID=A0A645IZ91_9ZZZZ